MKNPFSRKTNVYVEERNRIIVWMSAKTPDSQEYEDGMKRLNEIDRILNRTSELKKALIPALGTTAGVGAIYAIQQFGGILVPKALDAIAARSEAKKTKEQDSN